MKLHPGIGTRGARVSAFSGRTDGVAASKNWKTKSSRVHRSGTSIYRKKIDTQKVYIMAAPTQWSRVGPGGTRRREVWNRGVPSRKKMEKKAYSTQCSQVVAHLSTNWA